MDDLSIGETRRVNEPSCLQQTVSELGQWADQNHLHLNAAKCKQLQICFKRSQPDPPIITLGPNVLDVVTETKILGVWIQDDLKWGNQVEEMMSKSKQRVHILSRLKKFRIPHEDLVDVYKSYVRPALEYAAPVWHSGLTKQQTSDLEKIQK